MKNYFQFACELEPIDRFPGCMSKDDLLENLLRQDTQAGFLLPEKRTETALRVMQLEQEAEQRTCEISGGWFPRRVLFFAVPPVDGKACQICALTQSWQVLPVYAGLYPDSGLRHTGQEAVLPVRREEHHEAKTCGFALGFSCGGNGCDGRGNAALSAHRAEHGNESERGRI